MNEDDKQPRVEFDETAPKFDYLRGKPREVVPLPYWEPIVDLNSRRDVAMKVDQMKDIIKKLVYHIDPELVPKEEEPAKCEEKHKCEGIVAHAMAVIQGKTHGCGDGKPHDHAEAEPKKPEDQKDQTPGKPEP